MTEGPYWPLAIKDLEKAISKQLSERNFIFESISVLHQFNMRDMKNNFITILDGDNKARQIVWSTSIPREDTMFDALAKDICDGIIDANPNRVRYRKYKVYCQHCGAPIQPNEPHCPYCGQPYVEFNFKEE
jgi:rubrerythrin